MMKAFTFLPGHRSGGQDTTSGDTRSTLSKRREQLRRAQRSHRQRKDLYFKSLEKEVLRLRASEVDLLVQVQSLRDHVGLLQGILDKHDLSVLTTPGGEFETTDSSDADVIGTKNSIQCLEHVGNWPRFSESKQGVDFQRNNPSFHWSSQNICSGQTSDHSPQTHGNIIESTTSQQPALLSYPETHRSLSHLSHSQPGYVEHFSNRDTTDMGMEFVLSLERPCLPHLEHHLDKPNGHTLLASATLLHPHQHQCIPSAVSKQISSPRDPTVIFANLLSLSETLVLEDEVSPIQAWCYILQQSWADKLDTGKLRDLSASLLKIIKCHGDEKGGF
ncbi:hypothetical protein N7510_010427 [Penicillium lagena]|uniref:uncharacterized protein n=1 Tax=Penicillium lagena TaxID=94218 RepID=UPI002541FAB3|nr:uncharacterized protein N7510_010427 [Penicillium lagena]KAJ5605273.1 hypothetical protein N7510_010427 [Penicillium lagena]